MKSNKLKQKSNCIAIQVSPIQALISTLPPKVDSQAIKSNLAASIQIMLMETDIYLLAYLLTVPLQHFLLLSQHQEQVCQPKLQVITLLSMIWEKRSTFTSPSGLPRNFSTEIQQCNSSPSSLLM